MLLNFITIVSLFSFSTLAETEKNLTQDLIVQVLASQLDTQDSYQVIQNSYNRLSINLNADIKNKSKFLIEIEQFLNQNDRRAEINQFYAKSIDCENSWIWGLGYMPIPISKLNVLDDQLFLFTPLYHRDFFTDDRQLIESGFYFGYSFSKFKIQSGFYQRIKRNSTQTAPQAATLAPHFIQVSTSLFNSTLAVTHYAEQSPGLPLRESWGLSSESLWLDSYQFELESWYHKRIFSLSDIEESIGGYLLTGIYFFQKNLNLQFRFDYLTRINFKDAWGNTVENIFFNPAIIMKWTWLDHFGVQMEKISETQKLNHEQKSTLSGWLIQLTYSVQF